VILSQEVLRLLQNTEEEQYNGHSFWIYYTYTIEFIPAVQRLSKDYSQVKDCHRNKCYPCLRLIRILELTGILFTSICGYFIRNTVSTSNPDHPPKF